MGECLRILRADGWYQPQRRGNVCHLLRVYGLRTWEVNCLFGYVWSKLGPLNIFRRAITSSALYRGICRGSLTRLESLQGI